MSCIFKNFVFFLALNASLILAASEEEKDETILRKPLILKNCERFFPGNEELTLKAALTAAKDELLNNRDNDSLVLQHSIKLFKYAFAKGKGFKIAIEAATEGINSIHDVSRVKAFTLFGELVKYGRGIETAINIAIASLSTLDISNKADYGEVQEQVGLLFEILFDRGNGFQAAINYVTSGIHSENELARNNSNFLFGLLITRGQGIEAAIAAAAAGVHNSEDDGIVISALELFSELVHKGHGFEAAINAATALLNDESNDVVFSAVCLFRTLVRKGQGFEAAINAATVGAGSEDDGIVVHALDLFSKLVRKGHGFEADINAATALLNDESNAVVFYALDLLQILGQITEFNLGNV